jgi:hypothetical protein
VKLAIVVALAGDTPRAERLARAARAAGAEVSLFMMAAAAPWAEGAGAAGLVDDGCDVIVCATSFGDRRAAPGVVIGSQDDHAAIVSRADRVVALT